ncbi:MAG: VCBS repeat-containing protein, partial [Propionibacteriaceae bacterium]|nr:VCBS repeat-containing protein [Propionibacteriaceae bacterium]
MNGELLDLEGNLAVVVEHFTQQTVNEDDYPHADKIRVAKLPFGGASAPRLLGALNPLATAVDADFSKPLQAGTWTGRDGSGQAVATLATPASPDGSLRNLVWNGLGASPGTYEWTLAAQDAAGQAATDLLGQGPPTGTFQLAVAGPIEWFTLAADMTGDGRGEILAVDAAGALWLYPGRANGGVSAPIRIGWGWQGIRVYGPGDLDSDGKADLLAIRSNGTLWLYPGLGGGKVGQAVKVGQGWTGWGLLRRRRPDGRPEGRHPRRRPER